MQISTNPAIKRGFSHPTYDMVDWDNEFEMNEDLLIDGVPEEDSFDDWA